MSATAGFSDGPNLRVPAGTQPEHGQIGYFTVCTLHHGVRNYNYPNLPEHGQPSNDTAPGHIDECSTVAVGDKDTSRPSREEYLDQTKLWNRRRK